jgi:hypothetical protein
MNKKWSDLEKDYIRLNANTLKDHELAQILQKMTGRIITVPALRKVRQNLGLIKKQGRGICELY